MRIQPVRISDVLPVLISLLKPIPEDPFPQRSLMLKEYRTLRIGISRQSGLSNALKVLVESERHIYYSLDNVVSAQYCTEDGLCTRVSAKAATYPPMIKTPVLQHKYVVIDNPHFINDKRSMEAIYKQLADDPLIPDDVIIIIAGV